MENTLIIQDTLLGIAVGLALFGIGILSTYFWQGIIACIVAAGIYVVKVIITKKYLENFIEKVTTRILKKTDNG